MVVISNIDDLYTALDNPANNGETLVLQATGSPYKLDPTKPNKGRLEFRNDMSIIGDTTGAEKVVIETSALQRVHYTIPEGGRTGAIRMGRGHNDLSWVTVTNDGTYIQDVRALIQTDLGNEDCGVRIDNCIIEGGSIGVSVTNGPGSNRKKQVTLTANVFRNCIGGDFKVGVQVKNSSRVYSERNFYVDNVIGMTVFNVGSEDKTITVTSKLDLFRGNYIGLALYGAFNGLGVEAHRNTTRFVGESITVSANGVSSLAPADWPEQPCGFFAAGAHVLNDVINKDTSNNHLIVTLSDCYIKDNERLDMEVYGESQALPENWFKQLSNNTVLVHCRVGTIGNYLVKNSNNGNNDGINLATVVIEKTLPNPNSNLSVFDHIPDTGETMAVGSPAVIKLADSYCIPVWRAHKIAAANTTVDEIRSRDYVPLLVHGHLITKAYSDPMAFSNRSVHLILHKNKEHDGTITAIRLGQDGENYWSGEELYRMESDKIGSNPFGYCIEPENHSHIIYRGEDNHIYGINWRGFLPVKYSGNLTQSSDSPKCKGDPVGYYNRGLENIIIYRSEFDEILSLTWRDGPPENARLSYIAGAPLAADNPSALFIEKLDYNQIVYKGEDGHIYALYWQGAYAVKYWDIWIRMDLPQPSSKLSIYYNQHDNTTHVIFRAGIHLYEIWWVMDHLDPANDPPVRHAVKLTDFMILPHATDDPIAFATKDEPYEHLFYRSTDGHIYEVYI